LPPPRIILICTGLGGVNRGFETYMHGLATRLQQAKLADLKFEVWSAYSMRDVQYTHRRIPAIGRFNKILGKLTKDLHTQFHAEQQTMLPALLWQLIKTRPAAIYLGEYKLYCYLYKLRKWLRLSWSLCLHTGGQAIPGLFNPKRDWVHHVSNRFWDEALQRGIPAQRQFLIPHFLEVPPLVAKESVLPELLATARGKYILMSVGSLDESVKGMISLAKQLAPYSEKVFPVFVGEDSAETPELEMVLKRDFGREWLKIKLRPEELPNWYAAADLVVSFSKMESFGLVLLEAMLQGTPVMCFRWPAAPWVFEDKATFIQTDVVAEPGRQIVELLEANQGKGKQGSLREYVIRRFAWVSLKSDYLDMFNQLVQRQP
jgi:glycosyltransferase involved in cell wall biosynthesis